MVSKSATGGALKKKCAKQFHNIHKKTTVDQQLY